MLNKSKHVDKEFPNLMIKLIIHQKISILNLATYNIILNIYI